MKVKADIFLMIQVKQLQEPPEVGRGKEGFPFSALEGVCLFLYLDFGVLASMTMEEYISVVLIYPSLW